MNFQLTPHLNFDGQAQAALSFYMQVFGGDMTCVTYAEAGQAEVAKRASDILWGQVSFHGLRLMAFDVRANQAHDPGITPMYLVLHIRDEEQLREIWQCLANDGKVVHELRLTDWSPLYGLVTDKFKVSWVLSLPTQNAP